MSQTPSTQKDQGNKLLVHIFSHLLNSALIVIFNLYLGFQENIRSTHAHIYSNIKFPTIQRANSRKANVCLLFANRTAPVLVRAAAAAKTTLFAGVSRKYWRVRHCECLINYKKVE